jgi:hypothetical protein
VTRPRSNSPVPVGTDLRNDVGTAGDVMDNRDDPDSWPGSSHAHCRVKSREASAPAGSHDAGAGQLVGCRGTSAPGTDLDPPRMPGAVGLGQGSIGDSGGGVGVAAATTPTSNWAGGILAFQP